MNNLIYGDMDYSTETEPYSVFGHFENDTQSLEPYITQKFQNITRIGFGSYTLIWSAESKKDLKKYAIKMYTNPFTDSLQKKRRLNEVEAMSCIAHTNCVSFFSAFVELGQLYMQVELCQLSLSRMFVLNSVYFRAEKLSLDVFVDLSKAVLYLNSVGIIHSDISCDNVLFGFDGFFKLGDFGEVCFKKVGKHETCPSWLDCLRRVGSVVLQSAVYIEEFDINYFDVEKELISKLCGEGLRSGVRGMLKGDMSPSMLAGNDLMGVAGGSRLEGFEDCLIGNGYSIFFTDPSYPFLKSIDPVTHCPVSGSYIPLLFDKL